eukprot:scaffold14.g1095.t1
MEVEVAPRGSMATAGESRRTLAAFWLMGLLNNTAYVVMLAGATEISSGAAGLTFLAAVVPSLLTKASLPYWADAVGYTPRMWAAAALMAAAFSTVAAGPSRAWQLLGVAFASIQGGIGEFSCLALTSFSRDSRAAITMWSSGTGFAGVAGYAWVALLHVMAGLSFATMLRLANCLAVGFLAAYHLLLPGPALARRPPLSGIQRHDSDAGAERGSTEAGDGREWQRRQHGDDAPGAERQQLLAAGSAGSSSARGSSGASARHARQPLQVLGAPSRQQTSDAAEQGKGGEAMDEEEVEEGWQLDTPAKLDQLRGAGTRGMGWRERAAHTAALWSYMVPLITVYFAEYAMQSGAWTAIGFPVHDPDARKRFYVYSNWRVKCGTRRGLCYQAGVFVSRSSGMLWRPDRRALLAMPAQQCGWLAFFVWNAITHFWYSWGLLVPCFITGLLGGAVYVSAFMLISWEVAPELVEFSLGAASLADSLGVALADAAGVLIQARRGGGPGPGAGPRPRPCMLRACSARVHAARMRRPPALLHPPPQGCLWKANGLEGADFTC